MHDETVEYIYNYLLENYANNDEELLEIIVEESDLDVLIDLILENAAPAQAIATFSGLIKQILQNSYKLLTGNEIDNIMELKKYFTGNFKFMVPIPARYDLYSFRTWLRDFKKVVKKNPEVVKVNEKQLKTLKNLSLKYKIATNKDWEGII